MLFVPFVYLFFPSGYERTNDREISWPSPQHSVTEEAMLHSVKHFLERVWWAVLAYGIATKYICYEFFGKRIGKNRSYYGNGKQKSETRMSNIFTLLLLKYLWKVLSVGYEMPEENFVQMQK